MREYKAIFFDLDGTLLPMDTNEFLHSYFGQLGPFLASKGYSNVEELMAAILDGTKQACMPHEGTTNAEVFWSFFTGKTGLELASFEPLMEEFYTGAYNNIGAGLAQCTLSAQVLGVLANKGYPLYLTTMPLFPEIAVANRLQWVGLSADAFGFVTTYDNSYSVKPQLSYYARCLELAGLEGNDVLMVGNHTTEDLAACKLGCDAFLITDHLLNPDEVDYSAVKHGSMEDFLAFVEALPVCAGAEVDA